MNLTPTWALKIGLRNYLIKNNSFLDDPYQNCLISKHPNLSPRNKENTFKNIFIPKLYIGEQIREKKNKEERRRWWNISNAVVEPLSTTGIDAAVWLNICTWNCTKHMVLCIKSHHTHHTWQILEYHHRWCETTKSFVKSYIWWQWFDGVLWL